MEINYRGMEATLFQHDDYYEVVLSNNTELITFKDYEELKQEGLITEKEEKNERLDIWIKKK